ncbi:hypothetical protein [Microbacterium kunmingense]|uniref:hypothetical protein n=1 Tax=Microbacterium kunmingense TaxID=2915939 RepID=UPI003D761376
MTQHAPVPIENLDPAAFDADLWQQYIRETRLRTIVLPLAAAAVIIVTGVTLSIVAIVMSAAS